MALAVLRHVDAQQGALVAVDGFGQRLGEFGLADAGGTQEQERGHGLAAFAQTRARQPHRIRHRAYRLVLPHQALVQTLLQVQQLLALLHRQLIERDAGQTRDDLGHVFRLDFGAAEPLALPVLDLRLEFGLLGFNALTDLRRIVVLLAGGQVVLLPTQLVQLGLQLLPPGRAVADSFTRAPAADRWPCPAKRAVT